jgi:cation diffusion facilitator family transporter
MHSHSIEPWTHDHVFLGAGHRRNERRVWLVVALTVVMMIGEIAGGHIFGSLALTADGWHMSTHAAALGISGAAYLLARRHRHNARFTFGTGKFGDLAAFTSAILLAVVAAAIVYESMLRLGAPVAIHYRDAIAIAVLGLSVNLVSALLLGHDDHHGHSHGHEHRHEGAPHGHAHHDHNMRSAYLHVLADAATSVAAIAGLSIAWRFDWPFIDPLVGLLGAAVIASWAVSLIRSCSAVLLDTVPDSHLETMIRQRLELKDDRITDLHLWRVGPGHAAAVIALVSDRPKPPSVYKKRLAGLRGLSHITLEVEQCPDHR